MTDQKLMKKDFQDPSELMALADKFNKQMSEKTKIDYYSEHDFVQNHNTNRVEPIVNNEAVIKNPLQRYFRIPADIHLKLPSQGFFNNKSDFILTASGELEVFSMSAADELIIKNPDSLLNGHAIEKLLNSCIPGIKNVQDLPYKDIEAALLCIKYASSGDDMEMTSDCPKCKKQNTITSSIQYILSQTKPLERKYTHELDKNIIFNLKPYTFKTYTKLTLKQFEEANLVKAILADEEISNLERITQVQISFDRIADFAVTILSDSIISISTPDGNITDQGIIKDFLNNADSRYIKPLKEKIEKINTNGGVPNKVKIKCNNEKCQHEWETNIIYDPTVFFA